MKKSRLVYQVKLMIYIQATLNGEPERNIRSLLLVN